MTKSFQLRNLAPNKTFSVAKFMGDKRPELLNGVSKVMMYRDKPEDGSSVPANPTPAQRERMKTRSWIIEDEHKKETLTGSKEGSTGKYVLFIKQGDEFRMVRVHDWYTFRQKAKYTTLTTEEAEAQLEAGAKKSIQMVDRWQMMKKKGVDEDKKAEEDGDPDMLGDDEHFNAFGWESDEDGGRKKRAGPDSTSGENAEEGEEPIENMASMDGADDDEGEGMDFTELFDNDDGDDGVNLGEEPDGDVSDNEAEDTKDEDTTQQKLQKLQKLDKSGKEMQVLLSKENKFDYGSDGEDPYADEDEEEFNMEAMNRMHQAPKLQDTISPTKQSTAAGQSKQSTAAGRTTPTKKEEDAEHKGIKRPRATSPTTGTEKGPGQSTKKAKGEGKTKKKADKAAAHVAANVAPLTEEDVRRVLKQFGKLKTKELIQQFKHQLEDPEQKAKFSEIVKKVAKMEKGANGNEKYMVLKDS